MVASDPDMAMPSDPDVAVAVRAGDGVDTVGPTDTPWPVYSVTKMFVAAAALLLAEAGRLDLDAGAARYHGLAPAGRTVRDLLSHTGGLPDYARTAECRAAVDADPGTPWELGRVVAAGLRGDWSERGRFRYSNVGFWLAGAILERVADEELPDLLHRLVFAPAAMTSTRYPRVGAGVIPDGYDTRWAGPAGAAWSTPADIVTFLGVLFGGGLLAPASLARMRAPVRVDDAGEPWRRPGYGLGLMVDGELGTAGHGGGGPCYASAALIHPRSRRVAAVVVREPSTVDPMRECLRLVRPG